jgi:hypothetical protein
MGNSATNGYSKARIIQKLVDTDFNLPVSLV